MTRLRMLLGLPEANPISAAHDDEFRQAFRERIAGLNGDMQLLAAHGDRAAHGKLVSLRQTLYAAYQSAASQKDFDANQRVMNSAAKISEAAAVQKASVKASRDNWLKRTTAFDAVVMQIGELEDAGYPTAANYRALADEILAQANAHNYRQANALLDIVEPKLTTVHTLSVTSGGRDSSVKGETEKPPADRGNRFGDDVRSDATPVNSRGNPGQAPPSNTDIGNAKTPLAPSSPNRGNASDTGDDTPRIKASPGDGEAVSVKDALDEMRKKDGQVRESGSRDFHRRIWQQYMGKSGEPPIAFRYANEIRIDVERLTPDQHREWQELDKAKNPRRYPQPQAPPPAAVSTGARTVGSDVVEPPAPKGKPAPQPPAKKGWNAQVSQISPALTVQRSNEGVKVHASVSRKAHQQAWSLTLGQTGKAPVAYVVDNMIHVDMSRWPKDVPPPKLASGSGPPSQLNPKAPTASPPATKAPASQINLKQLENEVADFARRAEALNKAFESHERSAGKGGTKEEATKLHKQSESLKAEGDALVKKLSASPDLADVIGKTPKETFDRARAKSQRHQGGGALGALMQLANAVDLLQDIQYIFKAESALDGVQRAIQVGGKHAMGAAQMALITSITRSTPVAAVVTMVLGMCSDQAGACEEQEEARRQSEQEKQLRERARQEFLAIGRFLEETVPGAVERVEDVYHIKNMKVWEATVRRVDQLRREEYAKQKAARLAPFEKMGAEDGLAGAYPQKGKAWDSSENLHLQSEAVDAYDKSWKQGEARRKDALKRAKERGQRDGMEGKPIHLEQLWSFAEIDELRRRDLQRRGDGFSFTEAFEPFVEHYKQGHRSAQKTLTERTLQAVEMFEGKTLSGAQYASKIVHGVAKYSMGPDVAIGSKGAWSSSDRSKVDILIQGDYVHLLMNGVGKATITAKFEDGGVAKEGSIDVTVNPVKFDIAPSNASLEVGEESRYYATIKDAKPSRNLPLHASQWSAKPEGIVSISPMEPDPTIHFFDINGVIVRGLKEGKVTLTVMNKADKSTVKTTLTVKARKK